MVFSLGSNKAPRPDGMSAHFFKFYWNIIGGEVTEAIASFLRMGYLLKEISHSFISLIPKGNNTDLVKQLGRLASTMCFIKSSLNSLQIGSSKSLTSWFLHGRQPSFLVVKSKKTPSWLKKFSMQWRRRRIKHVGWL